MQGLNDFRLFVDVVEQNGFSAAARKLGLPRSRLSRRIGLLEESLGVRLIQRSTRQFIVTDIGQEFYHHCKAMVIEADAARDVIHRVHSEPQGTIKINCPPSLLYLQVGEITARFMAQYPKVNIILDNTNRRVDVIREGYDLVFRVRFQPLEDSDLIISNLGSSTQRLVASPDLLAHCMTRPMVPADLSIMPSFAWGPTQGEHTWCLDGPDGASIKIPYSPRLVTEDMVTLKHAALAGVGVCQLPTIMVHDDLKAGRLIDILPQWTPRAGIVHAVFPSRRGLLPSVRKLLDFMAKEYAILSEIEAQYLRDLGQLQR